MGRKPVHFMNVKGTDDFDCTAQAKGNNKFYDMFEKNGQLVCYYGRVPDTPFRFGDESFYNSIPRIASKVYPLSDWDKVYETRKKHGYTDCTNFVSSLITVKKDNSKNSDEYAPIKNKSVAEIIERLQEFAQKTISSNYKVNTREVTQEQVDAIQKCIDDLQTILKPCSDFYTSILSIMTATGDKQHPIRRKTKVQAIENNFNSFMDLNLRYGLGYVFKTATHNTISECVWAAISDTDRYKLLLEDIETKSNKNAFNTTKGIMNYFNDVFKFEVTFNKTAIDNFNRIINKILIIIPRYMDNVDDFKCKRLMGDDGAFNIISREESLLDTMRGQIVKNVSIDDNKTTFASNSKTILEANGLQMEDCTPEDIELIKRKLGSDAHLFKKAWRFKNEKQEKAFLDYCKAEGIRKKDCKLLWHGTRSENVWSILKTGLALRPSCGVLNGHMFGAGLYFASVAHKSLNYCSIKHSYWARGNEDSGFMILHSVAYGNPMDVYSFDSKYYNFNYAALKRAQGNANCLHAHAGSMLKNDEIIVYKEEQVMPLYLVEVGE